MELTQKTAVITGGASGIGLATARRFAAAGANLVLGDIEQGALDEAVASLRSASARVIGVATDVSVESDVTNLREAALAEFGGVHVVFNNAGVSAGATVGTPKAVWDWVLGVNLDGVINGVNVFVPHLLEQNEGHVINTASLSGLVGSPYMGPYCASKFAVVGLSESLFHELALSGRDVAVSVLCPGFVRTRINESERNMPDELAYFMGDPVMSAVGQSAADAVMSGIDASQVALAVEDALRTRQFWILPHIRSALGSTKQRREWMRGGPAPTIDLGAAAGS